MTSEGDVVVRNRVSLKDKLSNHYKNRDFAARPQTLNYLASSYTWYMNITCFILFIILAQELYVDEYGAYLLIVFTCMTLGEVILNWTLAARKSIITYSSSKSEEGCVDENKDKDNWPTCITCQQEVPPRSHHCSLCNVCVLKCDHHCFFTSTCIGFYNQRYFVVWLFWVTVSQAYGLYLLTTYLSRIYSMTGLFIPILPLYQWVVGDITGWDFYLYCHVYLCALTFAGSVGYFGLQLWTIKRGQTTPELFKNVIKYRQDMWTNFRSVFGQYWLINFIVPLPFGQEGDGVHWEIKAH